MYSEKAAKIWWHLQISLAITFVNLVWRFCHISRPSQNKWTLSLFSFHSKLNSHQLFLHVNISDFSPFVKIRFGIDGLQIKRNKIKVHLFWEGHEIWQNLQTKLTTVWAFHPILVTLFLVVFGNEVTKILGNSLFAFFTEQGNQNDEKPKTKLPNFVMSQACKIGSCRQI